MRSRAAARFCSCARCSLAVTVSTPSVRRPRSRHSIRYRKCSGTDEERATSKDSSTRLSVVLTPCPPGPDDLENRSLRSRAGITRVRVTARSSATPIRVGADKGTSTTDPTVLRPCGSMCALGGSRRWATVCTTNYAMGTRKPVGIRRGPATVTG